MTYPDSPHYFSLDDDALPTSTSLKVEFNEDETGRIYALAELWAERCVAFGVKPPPDPLRALLAAAENLYQAACVMDALHEQATLEADGGVVQ